MISISLSIDQLVEAVRNLNPAEKDQLREVLDDNEMTLSAEQQQIILQRQKAYNAGDMEAYSLDELKNILKYTKE